MFWGKIAELTDLNKNVFLNNLFTLSNPTQAATELYV